MNLTKSEINDLNIFSNDRWQKATPEAFFLHRKGLLDRRGTSKMDDEKSPGYEYRINQAGKDILTET